MSNGVERRTQVDNETVRGLLIVNGGGAVALLALLPQVLNVQDYRPLAIAILVGVLMMATGLALALAHNHFRRICSLKYEQHQMRPPRGRILGVRLWEPTVCCASIVMMWASVAMFFFAAVLVASMGLMVLSQAAPA